MSDKLQSNDIQEGARHNASGTPVSPYIHGSGGLFNMQGTDMNVISAIMSPLQGIAAELPVINGEYGTAPNSFGSVDEEVSIAITGITSGDIDTWSNQPTGDCADGPTGGLLKAGAYVNPYARFRGTTREVSMVRAGRLASLCEPLALQLMNQPNGYNGISSPSNEPSLQNAVNNELASRIFELLHSYQRMFSRRLWVGNPANNSGERRDLWGFENQINTSTHRDRGTGAIMTALDPDVKNFGFNLVSGAGPSIAQTIEAVDDYLQYNAEQMGLDPFEYDLVMRRGAFREIAAAWPITASFRALAQIASKTNAALQFDAKSVITMRDDMLNRHFLPVNGREVHVILDGSIPELNVTTAAQLAAGQYASDIYFIPRFVRGNLPATFFKYHNHNNGQEAALAQVAGPNATFTSDNGLFRWYVKFLAGCLTLTFDTAMKLVLIAPQLAGRITNVAYQPLQHEREVYPDSSYFFNGGNTNSTPTKFYSAWSPTTPAAL